MNRLLLLTGIAAMLLLFAAYGDSPAQPVVLKRDAGTPSSHDNGSQPGWEETMMMSPAGPCRLLELHVYYDGPNAGRDTVYITGDPSEGAIPPTSFVWSYNTLTAPIVVEYSGTPGWDTIDLRDRNLRYDGYDRIVIQHRVRQGGPWFAADASPSNPYSSFLFDPKTLNTLGFPGKYYLARGDFFVRALIEYVYPNGNTSQGPPPATLVDVARTVGIADGTGKALAGARASVADWNGDGWDDVAIGGQFFRNKGGTFENVTATIGIQAGASVWGDYDNDGDIDCYAVNGGAGDKIYRNNGDGTFTDATAASGYSNPYPTVMPIWFDFDHDGKLDLYIANGRTEVNGAEEYFPDQLWQGAGDGTFKNVTGWAGINEAEMAGSPGGGTYLDCWGAAPCDYDDDGWTDVFVATYRLAPDLLYRNFHNATFIEEGEASGVRGVPTAEAVYFGHGIGCDWGDYNNDGHTDLVVGNLGHPDWRGQVSNPSMVFRSKGDGTFSEVHAELGVKFFEMNAGVLWLDLDLDGNLDLWHCQYAYNAQGQNGEPRRLSRMYLNGGEGASWRLNDVTWHTGALIHGAWTAVRLDFDRDGDLDILAASPTDAVKLFRNDVPAKGQWLSLRLVGSPANDVPMDGYGTRVFVYANGKMFKRELQGGGSGATASQNSNELHFGTGGAAAVDSVVVRYPNGVRNTYTGVRTNASYTVRYLEPLVRTSGVGGETGLDGTLRLVDAGFSDGAIHFALEAPASGGEARAEVFDLLGRAVASMRLEPTGTGRYRLAVQHAVNGVYVLRVRCGNATATARVTVCR